MAWRLLAVALAVSTGGYMVADGARALLFGQYFGAELGPWAAAVRAVGVSPVSTPMEAAFIVLGVVWLAAAIMLARGSGAVLITVAATATLWYAPVGTLLSVVELVLVATRRIR